MNMELITAPSHTLKTVCEIFPVITQGPILNLLVSVGTAQSYKS